MFANGVPSIPLFILLILLVGLVIASQKVPAVTAITEKFGWTLPWIIWALIILNLLKLGLFWGLSLKSGLPFLVLLIGIKWIGGIDFKTFRKVGNIIIAYTFFLVLLEIAEIISIIIELIFLDRYYYNNINIFPIIINIIFSMGVFALVGLYYRYMEVSTFLKVLKGFKSYLKTDWHANPAIYNLAILQAGILVILHQIGLYIKISQMNNVYNSNVYIFMSVLIGIIAVVLGGLRWKKHARLRGIFRNHEK